MSPLDRMPEHPRGPRGLVTLVLPAKDEAEAIGATIRSLPTKHLLASGFATEVVVLDGHSRDATRSIAEGCGASVLPDQGRGKGSAVRQARGAFHGDYVLMLDADGTYACDAIPRVVAILASGQADVVMGDRRLREGAMSAVHRAGNALLSTGAAMLYGQAVPDVCTGLWGFRAEVLRSLPLRSDGFELESELFALSARLGLRIAHTPVDYLPRVGSSKITTADGLRIGWCLLRTRFARLPRELGRTASARPGRPDRRPAAVPET